MKILPLSPSPASLLGLSLGLLLLPSLSHASAQQIPQQGITQETWDSIRGEDVASLVKHPHYQKEAKQARVISSLTQENGAENYGSRYSAYLLPPEDGDYIFWLAGDDSAELFLSPNETPEEAKSLLKLNHYTNPEGFQPRNKSAKVSLKKGTPYYFHLLHKQAGGAGHIALAWEGPGMKRQLLSQDYTRPYTSPRIQKALLASAEKEALQKSLLSKASLVPPADFESWANALPAKEQNLLAEVVREMIQVARKDAPKKEALRPYLEKISHIVPSEQNPIKNPILQALLHAEAQQIHQLSPEERLTLKAHRAADSLGLPTDKTPQNVSVKLDSAGDKHREELVSTGVYALPGVAATITLPKELADKGLSLQIGHHIEPKDKATLVSMPSTTLHQALTKEKTSFASPHGGLVFLKVPQKVELKASPFIFEKVLAAPRFVLGKTKAKDWKKIQQSPAPWGELVAPHIVLLVKSEDLRALKDPQKILEWWNENNRRHEDFYGYYPKIAFRMHAALYAREGISYWPLEWQPKNMAHLLNLEEMKKTNSALYLHEHGHHDDFGDMEIGNASESTCNWAGYYMKEKIPFDWKDTHHKHLVRLLNPQDKQHNEIKEDGWFDRTDRGTHHWSYPITSMMIGVASDFTWQPIKKTLHRLRDHKDPMYQWAFTQDKRNSQAKIDRYLIGLSESTGYDVRPYFSHFKMTASEGANTHLDALKLTPWDVAYLNLPEGTPGLVLEVEGTPTHLLVEPGKSVTLDNPEKHIMTMSPKATLEWAKAQKGKVSVDKATGNLTYTAPKNFKGEDKVSYTITTASGKGPLKNLLIKADLGKKAL